MADFERRAKRRRRLPGRTLGLEPDARKQKNGGE
jgi:hypothetical protein